MVRQRKDASPVEKDQPSSHEKAPPTEVSRPGIPYKRMIVRFVLLIGSVLALNLYTQWKQSDRPFVGADETVQRRSMQVPCSRDYHAEVEKFPECAPKKCGRLVTDEAIDIKDAQHLLRVAKAGLSLGGSGGGASVLDLHSGALSKGDKFVNIYKVMEEDNPVFTEKDFDVYRRVKNKIHSVISSEFGIPKDKLYLTSPTFFSRMTTKPARTVHDEYWHVHVDKETYGSFHYTSLLYLTTYEEDFTGGRFIFTGDSKNVTVEPKQGRLSFFTSGSENPHYVEQLQSGTRFAITVSFTCDPSKLIDDPTIEKDDHGPIVVTSLLYLATYNEDFTGSRFQFTGDSKNITIEPRLGRLSIYTAGAENTHYVEKLESGLRHAVTFCFTCDPNEALEDLTLQGARDKYLQKKLSKKKINTDK